MFERGCVVRALSGRDKGRCFAVVKTAEDRVYLCDGKRRPIERPKLKSIKHLELLDRKIPEESITTNKLLRHALHEFNYTEHGVSRQKNAN